MPAWRAECRRLWQVVDCEPVRDLRVGDFPHLRSCIYLNVCMLAKTLSVIPVPCMNILHVLDIWWIDVCETRYLPRSPINPRHRYHVLPAASDVRHVNAVASKSVFCKLLRVRWLAVMPAWRGEAAEKVLL